MSLGVDSRLIQAYRNPFDCFDVHALVEVQTATGWVLVDPTFHLLFQDRDGRSLNALQVKQRLFHGQHDDLHLAFQGEVAYPPRHESYYVDLRGLLANVYVRCDASGWWGRLPPLR